MSDNIDNELLNSFNKREARTKQQNIEKEKLLQDNPAIARTPVASSLLSGAIDTAKIATDARNYINNTVFNQSTEPNRWNNIGKQYTDTLSATPMANDVGLLKLAGGLQALEASSIGLLKIGKQFEKEYFKKVLAKSSLLGSKMSAISPENYTDNSYNKNVIQNIEPKRMANSIIDNTIMTLPFEGIGLAGSKIKSIIKDNSKLSIKNIKNVVSSIKNKTTNIKEYIKDPTATREARIFNTDEIGIGKRGSNSKSEISTNIPVINKKKISSLRKDFNENGFIDLGKDYTNSNIKENTLKKKVLILNAGSELDLDTTHSAKIIKAEPDDITIKTVMDSTGFTESESKKLIENNDLFLTSQEYINKQSNKTLANILEHEIGHAIDINIPSYMKNEKKLYSNIEPHLQDMKIHDREYYFKPTEVNQQIGSLLDLDKQGEDITNKKAYKIYSKFNNDTSLTEPKDILINAEENIYKTMKTGELENTYKPSEAKAIEPQTKIQETEHQSKKVKPDSKNDAFGIDSINFDEQHSIDVKNKAKEVISKSENRQLKDDIEFASKTPQEHFDILNGINEDIEKEQTINNVNKVLELEKQKTEYLNRLYKMLGFDNKERLSSIDNELLKITNKIDNRIETLTKRTNQVGLDKGGGIDITKAKNVNSPQDKFLIKQYEKFNKAIIKAKKEKLDVLRKILTTTGDNKLDHKIYNLMQKDAINNIIEKHNKDIFTSPEYADTMSKSFDSDINSNTKSTKNAVEPIPEHRNINKKKTVKTAYQKDLEKRDLIDKKKKHIEKKETKQEKEIKKNKEPEVVEKEPENRNIIHEITAGKYFEKMNIPSIDYIFSKLKNINLKLKYNKNPKFKYSKIKIDRIKNIQVNDRIAYFDTSVKLPQFSMQKSKNLNFVQHIILASHEITHQTYSDLIKQKTSKLHEKVSSINVPKSIDKLYNNISKERRREEALAFYSEIRTTIDVLENSNLNDIVNKELLPDLKQSMNELFSKEEIKKLDSIYNEYFKDNIRKYLNENLKDTLLKELSYYREHADKEVSQTIDTFVSKLYKKISNNKAFKNISKTLRGSYIVQQLVKDFKISHSKEPMYEKIRNIFNQKNKFMNIIKNENNSYTQMINATFKDIDTKTQQVIHSSNLISSFFSSTANNLKEHIETLKISKDFSIENLISDLKLEKESIILNKIFKTSSEPTINSKLYFRNATQIVEYINNKFLDEKLSKEDFDNYVSDVDRILTGINLENHTIDLNGLERVIKTDEGMLALAKVDRDARDVLGRDYIRGYTSFIPKKPIVSFIKGISTKVPEGFKQYKNTNIYYAYDLRGNISNNLMEFSQDKTLGSEFSIGENHTTKDVLKLKRIIKRLDEQKIKYSYVRDKKSNIIGVKLFTTKEFDKEIMGFEPKLDENIASQNTSLHINSVNQKIAENINKNLKNIFITEEDYVNLKNKQHFTKLSNSERKAFLNAGIPIKYIRNDFHNLLDSQKEFMFSSENQRVFRAVEKTWKDTVKSFKKNVTFLNLKSQVNNAMVIPSVAMAHGLNMKSVAEDIINAPREYKTFYETIYKIKKLTVDGTKESKSKAIRLFNQLQTNNTYAQLYMNGSFQTVANDYLMKASGKDTLLISEVNNQLNKIFSEKTTNKLNYFKDLILLEPHTTAGSFLLNSMNFMDITGRAVIYKNLLKKGHSPAEATRLTNEAFVDFRRTYPKIVNELDDYGLFFAGFMYKNSATLLKTIKDKPVTALLTSGSLYALSILDGDNNSDTTFGVKSDSWTYQKSLVSPRFFDMSLFVKLYNGEVPKQLLLPNTDLMIYKTIKHKDPSYMIPVTTRTFNR